MKSIPIPAFTAKDIERFDANIPNKPAVGCWPWCGYLMNNGYGQVRIQYTKYLAHRISYTMVYGPIADGYEIDHTCHNPGCVRPTHLEVVTRSEHLQRTYRRDNATHPRSQVTHCPQGHAYDEYNTYISPNGKRHCRCCRGNQRKS